MADIELKPGVALAHDSTRVTASLHATTLGSLELGVVVAAAAVLVATVVSSTVARRVEMHPAASVPAQQETKSEPPTAAHEVQKAGVQAFHVSVSKQQVSRSWPVVRKQDLLDAGRYLTCYCWKATLCEVDAGCGLSRAITCDYLSGKELVARKAEAEEVEEHRELCWLERWHLEVLQRQ